MKSSLMLQKVRKIMENKNEKSMTLEEMISEMLKDAKVVKIPIQSKLRSRTSPRRHICLML